MDHARITRRAAITAGVGAAAAGVALYRDPLGLTVGSDDAPKALLGAALARGVALGPGGFGVEQRYPANSRYVNETRCTWVRLWAEWPKIQPSADREPDFGPLDAEIAAARADGVKVMLTSWRYPGWANGSPVAAGKDPTFQPAGRPDRDERVRPLDGRARRARRRCDRGRQRAELPALAAARHARHGRADDGHRARRAVRPTGCSSAQPRPTGAAATRRHRPPGVLDCAARRAGRDRVPSRATASPGRTTTTVTSSPTATSGSPPCARSCGERWPGIPLLVTESGARLTSIARDDRELDAARDPPRQAELITRGYARMREERPGAGVRDGPAVPVHHRPALRLRASASSTGARARPTTLGGSCQTALDGSPASAA